MSLNERPIVRNNAILVRSICMIAVLAGATELRVSAVAFALMLALVQPLSCTAEAKDPTSPVDVLLHVQWLMMR